MLPPPQVGRSRRNRPSPRTATNESTCPTPHLISLLASALTPPGPWKVPEPTLRSPDILTLSPALVKPMFLHGATPAYTYTGCWHFSRTSYLAPWPSQPHYRKEIVTDVTGWYPLCGTEEDGPIIAVITETSYLMRPVLANPGTRVLVEAHRQMNDSTRTMHFILPGKEQGLKWAKILQTQEDGNCRNDRTSVDSQQALQKAPLLPLPFCDGKGDGHTLQYSSPLASCSSVWLCPHSQLEPKPCIRYWLTNHIWTAMPHFSWPGTAS